MEWDTYCHNKAQQGIVASLVSRERKEYSVTNIFIFQIIKLILHKQLSISRFRKQVTVVMIQFVILVRQACTNSSVCSLMSSYTSNARAAADFSRYSNALVH